MAAKHGLPEDRPDQCDEAPERDALALRQAAALQAAHGERTPDAIVAAAIASFGDGVAAVSSFGADSAVLLHMIAQVDRHVPIIFLDTGKHFGETIEYRDQLLGDLGLTGLRIVDPRPERLTADDPDGLLHKADVDACCEIRKVEPMARAVEPYLAWFTGRKRFQAATRVALPAFEAVGPRIRINPLAAWTAAEIGDYMHVHGLRINPLVAYGYLSIGCFPCTRAVQPGEDARAGRWSGQAKTECGIHLPGMENAAAADKQGSSNSERPAA